MNKRETCVAGQFYPANKRELETFLRSSLISTNEKKSVTGVIVPHAGYLYSGKTAAMTIANIIVPDTVLLLGPNHTGAGSEFSIMERGVWKSPLGDVAIDSELSKQLLHESSLITNDRRAHLYEHSLEVEIPFLQFSNPNVRIVPLTISSFDLTACVAVGKTIAQCVAHKNILLLASTDMTHYESHESAKRKDQQALEAIYLLDEDKLASTVNSLKISMCGFLAVYILIVAAKELGATRATLVDYRTSGETSGDYEQVVGYAGLTVE